MPYSLGETDIKPKYFNYNGFGIGGIKHNNGKIKVTANCALYFLMPTNINGAGSNEKYHLNLTDGDGFYYCMKCNFGYALRIKSTAASKACATTATD